MRFFIRDENIELSLIGNIDLIKSALLKREELLGGERRKEKLSTYSRAMLLQEFKEERRKSG